MLAGISTRRYTAALEPVGEAVAAQSSSTSKSAVSRRFVAATAERLAELEPAPLDGQRWLTVCIDGFGLGEHTLVGVLGVTADGTKVPLGVAEGSTENAAVATRLLADLAARGLDADKGILSVVDGRLAPPPRPSVTSTAASRPSRDAVATRNAGVTDHLPEAERPSAQRKRRAAWANPDPAAARAELDALARAMAKKRPGAAASLREGSR